eukprot:2495262-Amphidinium_carterae.1
MPCAVEDDECGVTVINSNEWDSVGGHGGMGLGAPSFLTHHTWIAGHQLGQTRPVGMQMREWSSRSSANHW